MTAGPPPARAEAAGRAGGMQAGDAGRVAGLDTGDGARGWDSGRGAAGQALVDLALLCLLLVAMATSSSGAGS